MLMLILQLISISLWIRFVQRARLDSSLKEISTGLVGKKFGTLKKIWLEKTLRLLIMHFSHLPEQTFSLFRRNSYNLKILLNAIGTKWPAQVHSQCPHLKTQAYHGQASITQEEVTLEDKKMILPTGQIIISDLE